MIAPFASLAGRTAVVTGGAQGIGRSIVDTLVAVGMTVLVVDRDEAALKELPAGVTGVRADLAEDDWTGVEAALTDLPPLKAWVNNAGVVSHQRAEDIDLVEFDRVMRINAAAVVRGAQVARRHIGTPGAIVNVTSMSVDRAMAERLTYATSKSAAATITRYLAQEWGPHGIRVNAVCPGYIDTRLTTNWADDDPRQKVKVDTLAGLALRRAGQPTDIANAVLFLCSDLAAYVAGDTLYVDGGWHLA